MFLVAALAIAAAAVGPMFVESANKSVFSSTLSAAPPGEPDLDIISTGTLPQMSQMTSTADHAVRLSKGLLAKPILSADVGVNFKTKSQGWATDVLARTDICAHVKIVSGSCPRSTGQVAMSRRSSRAAGVRLGERISFKSPFGASTQVTVTGIYLQPATVDDAYWEDINDFGYGTVGGVVTQLDPLIATFGSVLTMNFASTPSLEADIGWRPSAAVRGIGAVEGVEAKVRSLATPANGLTFSTQIGPILASASREDNLTGTVVLTIVLELVLLALLILYTLGRSTAVARQPEAEFARRHGFSRSALFAFAAGEPAVLIVAALPVGFLIAWGALVLFAQAAFVHGTPVSLSGLSFGTACGACLTGILATALASYRLWQQDSGASEQRRRAFGLTVDAFAVALALAGLLSLVAKGALNGRQTNPLASLAPGLLALGAGIIGLRIAAFVIRLMIARTRESSHVSSFLALRQVGRRATVLRQLLPLTVATAVVIFAVGSFYLAASNRALLANFDTGTARVVDVTVLPGVDLITQVRRADPSGRQAMAAALYSSPSGTLLAVDSSRLAAVASWPSQLSRLSIVALAHKLPPPAPPGITFSGSRIRVTVDLPARTPPIALGLTLFNEKYQSRSTVDIEPIRAGLHSYAASLQGSCITTCRLLDLSPAWANPNENYGAAVRLTIRGIATDSDGGWHAVPFGAGQRGRWSAQPSSVGVQRGTASTGVTFDIPSDLLAISVLLSPVDLPSRVPALVTQEFATINPPSSPGGGVSLDGLDGNTLTVHPIAEVPTLPLIGQNGALVDLGLAQRAITSSEVDTTFQVWLSPSASPSILQRLKKFGITIGLTTLASTRLGALDHQGLALGYALGLIASPVAALLALGTVAFVIIADGQRRRRELTALAIARVPEQTVRRSLLLENTMVLVTALVVGFGIGLGAAALALSSLPEFASGTGGLPISTAVPLVPELVVLGAFVVLVGGVAELTTRLTLRGAGRPRGPRVPR